MPGPASRPLPRQALRLKRSKWLPPRPPIRRRCVGRHGVGHTRHDTADGNVDTDRRGAASMLVCCQMRVQRVATCRHYRQPCRTRRRGNAATRRSAQCYTRVPRARDSVTRGMMVHVERRPFRGRCFMASYSDAYRWIPARQECRACCYRR